jgi:hypothetical protein
VPGITLVTLSFVLIDGWHFRGAGKWKSKFIELRLPEKPLDWSTVVQTGMTRQMQRQAALD